MTEEMSNLRRREASGLPHVPTSVTFAHLLEDVPADRVNFGWLIGGLEKRSFGLLLLLISFLGLAPGIATLAAILLLFPAIQMILGRENPSLPRILAVRHITTQRFSWWVARAIPILKHLELFIYPRWHTPFQATKRVVGLIVFVLAITLLAPFPFNIIPTLAIMLISFAYLEEDGALLCISLIAAFISVSVTSVVILETLKTTGVIESLFAR